MSISKESPANSSCVLNQSHLSKTHREYCNSDKDTPDHDPLIQLLSSVSTLGLPQSVVCLIINYCIQILMYLLRGGLHLEISTMKCWSKKKFNHHITHCLKTSLQEHTNSIILSTFKVKIQSISIHRTTNRNLMFSKVNFLIFLTW